MFFKLRRKHILLALVAGAVVCILSLGLWWTLKVYEAKHINNFIAEKATSLQVQINDSIQDHLVPLRQLSFQWQPIRSQKEWEALVDGYLKYYPSFQAIEWVDSSFHVRWVAPMTGNEKVVNANAAFEASRRAGLTAARAQGKIFLSNVVDLLQGRKGLIAFVPIYMHNSFNGYIVGVFKVPGLLTGILEHHVFRGFNVTLREGTQLIYQSPVALHSGEKFNHKATIDVLNLHWSLVMGPEPATLKALKTSVPNVFLFGGLMLGLLVAVSVYFGLALRQALIQNRKILEAAGEGIFGLDIKGKITFINPSAVKLLGYSNESELLCKDFHSLAHEAYADGMLIPRKDCIILQVLQDGEEQQCSDQVFWKRDGNFFPVSYLATPLGRSKPAVGVVVTFNDITEELKIKESLARMAHYDYLTGMANRAYFDEMLHNILEKAKRLKQKFALLYIDLDDFKIVNDTMGHDAGDELLREVAKRMCKITRAYDFIARLGGDEYAIILQDIKGRHDVEALSEKLIAAMTTKFIIQEKAVQIGASVGIACFPEAGDEATTLAKHADQAMYEVKRSGKNQYQFYN